MGLQRAGHELVTEQQQQVPGKLGVLQITPSGSSY